MFERSDGLFDRVLDVHVRLIAPEVGHVERGNLAVAVGVTKEDGSVDGGFCVGQLLDGICVDICLLIVGQRFVCGTGCFDCCLVGGGDLLIASKNVAAVSGLLSLMLL
ncbi:MAG: hypothetical protein IJ171_03585 [Ruminococcus sp.]|nr:hypothetical protein [Ruminococcus sp.]